MRADKSELRDLILKITYRSPGLTAWQIAKQSGRNAASVSGMLAKMIKRGELRRDHADAERGWQYYHVNERSGSTNLVSTATPSEEEGRRVVSGERVSQQHPGLPMRPLQEAEGGSGGEA